MDVLGAFYFLGEIVQTTLEELVLFVANSVQFILENIMITFLSVSDESSAVASARRYSLNTER